MLLVQYGYIFLVLIFLLLFSSPKGSENKETKKSKLGKYISYCTLSRAITITYCGPDNLSIFTFGYLLRHLSLKDEAFGVYHIKYKIHLSRTSQCRC